MELSELQGHLEATMFSYSVKYTLSLSFKLKTYLPEKRDLLFVRADVLFHVPDV